VGKGNIECVGRTSGAKMNREDIIRMAREACSPDAPFRQFVGGIDCGLLIKDEHLERFAALVAKQVRDDYSNKHANLWIKRIDEAVNAERNKLAAWMTQYGFATGHGSTMEQLCDALGTEIVDSIKCEVEAERRPPPDVSAVVEAAVEAEREVCAQMVDHILKEGGGTYGDAIRARNEK
jgi:hypothetical protein